FLFDGNDPEQRRAFRKALDLLYREVVVPLGGSITGEHGVGLSRGDYIELEHGAKAVGLMREIKRIFDPNMILNPYKAKGGPWPPPMGIGGLH
ncbi:MAG: FAD-linked oxidase C-terminal domain-containing protein, partial [Candidatus Bathyarchaeia archaeon]